MLAWVIVGASALLVGSAIYLILWLEHRAVLQLLSFPDRFVALIAYIPAKQATGRPPAIRQIVAGVCICIGSCIVAGVLITRSLKGAVDYHDHGTLLSVSGLVFAVLLSMISFWTLWQTKRIEARQGTEIHGFKRLTDDMARDIESVHADFHRRQGHASEYDRFYIVTKNPYFGVLSFYGDDVEKRFRSSLTEMALDVHRSTDHAPPKFSFGMICGTPETVSDFCRSFYDGAYPNWTEQARALAAAKAAASTEKLLSEIKAHAGEGAVIRKQLVPDVQFAVIGTKVFEFVLTEPGKGSITGIHGARRSEDPTSAARFSKMFEILKAHLP